MRDIEGIRGIPFDATEIPNPDGEGYIYDNVYYSEDFAEWYRQYFCNGILIPGDSVISDQLEVVKTDSLSVQIKPGAIIVCGRNGIIYNTYSLSLSAVTQNKRIDRIVIEMNEQENRFNIKVVQGEEAAKPTKPDITRKEVVVGVDTYEVYQMSLAAVTVDSTGIVSVEDERQNDTVCGISQVIIGVKKPLQPTADSAANISYDGSETGSSAINVQEAIDELHDANNIKYDEDSSVVEAINERAITITLSTTIPSSGWTGSLPPYQNVVSISGIETNDSPIVDLDLSAQEYADVSDLEDGWSSIYRISCSENSITCYAKSMIGVNLPIKLKVVR